MSTQIVYIDNDIRPESEWDIDGEACALCEKHFSLIGRRHHCRSCGLCACDTCAPYTIALTKNKIETCRIRICTVCSQSSLAVSPLSRISHPATPIVKGKSAGSSSNEVSDTSNHVFVTQGGKPLNLPSFRNVLFFLSLTIHSFLRTANRDKSQVKS